MRFAVSASRLYRLAGKPDAFPLPMLLTAFAGRLVWRLYRAETPRVVAGAPAAAIPPTA